MLTFRIEFNATRDMHYVEVVLTSKVRKCQTMLTAGETDMNDAESHRIALRRETHDINAKLAGLVDKLASVDPDAERAVKKARLALFEAWTALCAPPDDEDDH